MDEQGQGSADRLTPAQSEAVRRLLAAAREDEGIPDNVAARLDATLSELTAERDEAAPATVVPLRRRRWPQVLVAAAAVVLIGYGTTQVGGFDGGGEGGDAGGTLDEPAAQSEAGGARDNLAGSPGDLTPSAPLAEDEAAEADGFIRGLQPLSGATLTNLGVTGLRQIQPGTLARDLKALTRATVEGSRGPAYNAQLTELACGPYYTVDGGDIFAASYRRHLALVLFHPQLDGLRLVEIYDCESATPRRAARTVTLQSGE